MTLRLKSGSRSTVEGDEDMQFDPLNDAFVSIFNAEQAGHYEVTVKPASKLLGRLIALLLFFIVSTFI